jgi:hypothetical protein
VTAVTFPGVLGHHRLAALRAGAVGDIYEVFLRREIGGIFSRALFRLERSDIPDYIINMLLTGRVANRI